MLLTASSRAPRLGPVTRTLTRGLATRANTQANDRFSIFVNGSGSKRDVLECASEQNRARASGVSQSQADAVVVLASRDLAAWLDDDAFVSSLLQRSALGSAEHGESPSEISVLAAVIDGLSPSRPFGQLRSGFSVLQGHADSILPSFWDMKQREPGSDEQSSVSMLLNPLPADTRSLQVTVPLANTIFQNGRQSTLLASRWRKQESGSFTLSQLEERTSQVIIPSMLGDEVPTSLSVPLLPISPPRKVVAGLGNIVRQVEIDGQVSPASKELEANIPRLLDARARSNPDSIPGPIGVWALVAPESVVESGMLDMISTVKFLEMEGEKNLADDFAKLFPKLLTSGCHLHKILSGGGGWGLKQGLLSLDPQTTFTTAGDDDVESFIKSFKGETTADSIVTPGSYVQFFVSPIHSQRTQATSESAGSFPTTILGSHDGNVIEGELTGKPSVEIAPGHFGGISTQGLFILSTSTSNKLITKLDTPNSYIWNGSHNWL